MYHGDDKSYEEYLESEINLILNADKLTVNWESIIMITDVSNMLSSVTEMFEKIDHLNIVIDQYRKNLIKKQVISEDLEIIKNLASYSSGLSQLLVLKCDVLIKNIPENKKI